MKKYLLITFLLATFVGKSQITLTVGEIYDFEINDELQLKNMDNVPPNSIRILIIGKYYSTLNDTVFYIRHFDNYSSVVNYNPTPHLDYSFNSYVDTVEYTNLDSTIISRDYGFHNDTILDSLCGVPTIGWYTIDSIPWPLLEVSYGKGLGVIKDVEYWEGAYAERNNGLYYFKKENFTCGTPDLTTSVEIQNHVSESIEVFPNPFIDKFYIKFSNVRKEYLVSIYDLMGIKLVEGKVDQNINVIINSKFEKGVYIIKVESEGKIYTTRVFKI